MEKKIIVFLLITILLLTLIWYNKTKEIKSDIVSFEYSTGSSNGCDSYSIKVSNNKLIFKAECFGGLTINGTVSDVSINKEINSRYLKELSKIIEENNIYEWDGFNKSENSIMDGIRFRLKIEFKDGKTINARGYSKFPQNYFEAVKSLGKFFVKLENL